LDGLIDALTGEHLRFDPSEVEVEMLKAYSLPAADHVYRLLGDASLAVKAEQMSQQLYVGTLGNPGRPDLLNAQRDRTG
jgi:hypothetical protein